MRPAPRRRGRLARLLIERRAALGLTLRMAAAVARVDTASYFRAEQGKMPSVRTALALCQWLGVAVETAFGGDAIAGRCPNCAVLEDRLTQIRSLATPSPEPRDG